MFIPRMLQLTFSRLGLPLDDGATSLTDLE